MGYLSTIALHTKGDKKRFVETQKDYFDSLKTTPVTLWEDEKCNIYTDTLLETRESYIAHGKHLWKELSFEPEDNCMYGKILWKGIKWVSYFQHQCELLFEVLTKNGYSWYFIHLGQVDEDIYIKNNGEEVKDFDNSVFKPYVIDHHASWPVLEEA